MRAAILFLWAGLSAYAATEAVLTGTRLLDNTNDLSREMVMGIDRFLMRETAAAARQRTNLWKRDFSSAGAYAKSIEPNRERFKRIIGGGDPREPVKTIEFLSNSEEPTEVATSERFTVHRVRWPVFANVHGEGLLLRPKSPPVAGVVALPDADQTPEMMVGLMPGVPEGSRFPLKLAEAGCEVLIVVLVDRRDRWSGNERLKRFTNQPHREWIYRQSYQMGRHIIGYEVQKVLAAVDYLARDGRRVGVIGYGEGGLVAFYAGALDSRIHTTAISGYFDSRQRLWEEPIYRNVFGLLTEFGDAEIASLIAPRSLVLEYSEAPKVEGPPAAGQGRGGAAPGRIATPEFNSAEGEIRRANTLMRPLNWEIQAFHGNEGTAMPPGSEPFIKTFLHSLSVPLSARRPTNPTAQRNADFRIDERQRRQVSELVEHTQHLLLLSESMRAEGFWKAVKTDSARTFQEGTLRQRTNFWHEVIGWLPPAAGPANARSRQAYDKAKWTGYDVVLDVYPDVFAWGVLLLPKDLKAGERRPVVVCQHGLEGVPHDTIAEEGNGYGYYKAFSARLAERGFVVFAPHNPYRGRDQFRVLQRKANPLGKSLFSVIIAQHERILDWLSAQPFVDAERIGFYGLSYGGKTAMRVPAVLDRYALSICSADFNEWIRKNVTTESPYSYLFTIEYEMPEFNLGPTFNYAEMAALIAPRPFMVERGHDDGVAPDEWVAYEYAKVRRLYAKLGIPERTDIEFFNGPHTINGQGTFRFLHKHLNWPER
jgi:dienelactone hydrolase